MKSRIVAAVAFLLGNDANAQSLASRVAAVDGLVQLRFARQPGVCGDGVGSIENILGRRAQFHTGNGMSSGARGLRRPCSPGPVRVVASVVSGQVVNLKTYVGPEPDSRRDITDLGTVPTPEATTWLTRL